MRKVLQTTQGLRGNCFQACVASILGVELDAVPRFRHPVSKKKRKRLKKGLNGWQLYLLHLQNEYLPSVGYEMMDAIVDINGGLHPQGYSILAMSAIWRRSTGEVGAAVAHAVVCKDGKPVWDPIPGNQGAEIMACQPLYWIGIRKIRK